MAATLDAASGGRALLGLGAGWDQREYEAYGYPAPYPATGERLRRLGEAAQVVTSMLRSPAQYRGRPLRPGSATPSTCRRACSSRTSRC